MNIHRFTLLAALLTSPAFAQTNTFPSSGNVGIGTTAPQYKLQVVANNPTGDNWLGAFSPGVDPNGNRLELIFGYHGGEDYAYIQAHHEGVRWSPLILQRYDGNVGIGGLPRQKLEVGAPSNPAINIHDFNTAELTLGVNEQVNYAQFNTNSSGFRFVTGQDGLNFPGSGSEVVRITSSGNVGIGTTVPAAKLQLHSDAPASLANLMLTSGQDRTPRIRFNGPWSVVNPTESYAQIQAINDNGGPGNSAASLHFFTSSGDPAILSDKMMITGTGNVGIGTTVNGTIKAKEIIVETTGWSDYVFADDYKLASLDEVEAHIKTNKHLPGIPSAAQVAEKGVNLGDMQAALLAKIEEITLHQIAQQKELSALKSENAALKARVQQLEAE